MTRSFLYPGSRRVIASPWPVDDEASSELLSRLYRMMVDRSAPAPATALRRAHLEIRRDARWSSPFYWASLVQQGEP